MDARRLADILRPLPPDTQLPAGWILSQLGLPAGSAPPPDHPRDLTAEEVAALAGRSRATVARWLREGTLRGYRLHGREWRVSPGAWAEFLECQRGGGATREPAHPSAAARADLSSWRAVRRP